MEIELEKLGGNDELEDIREVVKYEEATSQLDDCTSNGGNGNIPRLFFNLYFGCGALLYTLLTLWVFFVCLFGTESFAVSGVYYMLALAGLMWFSTILTVLASQFSRELGTKDINIRATVLFFLVLLLKLLTDVAVFYGSIEALMDNQLVHYHEFSQFVGPLIYFGLLYLVTIIEMVVILTTIAVMEDRCGIYATFMKVQEAKVNAEAYLRSKFPSPSEV